MFGPRLFLSAAVVAQCVVAAARAQAPDPRIQAIVSAASARRIEADIRRLVAFGTRHTLSDTVSATRGIGAARRWIHSEFQRISRECGGCLEVRYVGDMVTNPPRIPVPAHVVSVIAIQRGTTDPNRVLFVSGHFDSRNSDPMDAVGDAPGANDDASGTAVVLEAARVLSRHRFNATIVYAALAGEEQGLNGGQIVARMARDSGWQVQGVLNNDIVGNTRGMDGISEDTTVRVFSDGTPPTETDQERARRRLTGGEVDGISRQLARYVDRIADTYLRGFNVWMIYRLDRFGRGGDHRAFADLGFPAVRISETHEHYDRQHQNVRVEAGRFYGDVPDSVNFGYVARVAALNAASLASLAWAPGPPRTVRISGAVQPAAILTWEPPSDSGNVAGYRVYWRRTDSPTWDHSELLGAEARRYVATGRVIDNWFFGVAAVGREGSESTVVFPVDR
ncbi:MAG TPA: M28 family metallopeptidase [Gemmatimonadales bacterium]|nr:M28 family metallopeptidase [Gemmatimonadales bacterium]